MATDTSRVEGGAPSWLLAFGPFLVIAAVALVVLFVLSLINVERFVVTGFAERMAIITVIGFVAGILPVAIGMLWFPYVRRLEVEWIHAVLAFSAGILGYIAFEMADAAVEHAGTVGSAKFGVATVPIAGFLVAGLAALVTLVVMEVGSRWRKRKTTAAGMDGLRVAYLVAIGLGLHSVGEGLAIGTAFVLQETGLVVLLTVGFIIHNVTEGPAVIAALAREAHAPPLRHFAALGVLAGGGVIVGGWVGSLTNSALVAAIFFAIAFGAILQVVWEMVQLVRRDAETVLSPRLLAAFVVGVAVLFFLEEILVGTWLL